MKVKLFAIGLLTVLMVSMASPSFAGRASAASAASAIVTTAPVASAPAVQPAFFKFDRTRFLIDMGIAFWCIHHVYKNYTNHVYDSGASHRVTHLVAAGALLLIAYGRLKAAYNRANESNSKTLHVLVMPINGLLNKTQNIGNTLHGAKSDGDVSPSTLTSSMEGLNSTTSQVGSMAGANGYAIKDIAPPTGVPAGA